MSPGPYAIIVCGGSGTRLWPRSRSSHPKHLLQLQGAKTLVQETVAWQGLPPEQIFCITEASHAELLRQQLPDIPEENIIIEPERRGTASAIGLAIYTLRQRGIPDDAVVYSVHADQVVSGQERSLNAWKTAVAELDRLVLLGIKPTYPATGFGYIKQGRKLLDLNDFTAFEIDQFVEKPNLDVAREYVGSGNYAWNAGWFAAKLGVFAAELKKHMPEMVATLEQAVAGDAKQAKAAYLTLPTEMIEYGVLEKSDNLAVIPGDFTWADVGSWADLHDMLERDADDNVFEGEYVDIDSHNCFVFSPDRLVATIGLDNLVIINTGDAVLICPKDRSQDVKKVVDQLKKRNMTTYL